MRKPATLLALLTLLLGTGLTQEYKILTRPKPPSREVLDRLSLKEAWRAHLKTDGPRDGLLSVQVINGKTPKDNPQVLVQTFSGMVVLLDGETGDTLWRATVGQPYWPGQPAAYNASSIIITRREFLYVLNRANGFHRIYRLDNAKQPVYGFQMLAAATAGGVADDEAVYLPMNARIVAYDLFDIEAERPGETGERAEPRVLPETRWSYLTAAQTFLQPPREVASRVGVVGSDGVFLSLNKFEGKVRFDHAFQGAVSAGMAQHGQVAYVPSEDTILYALNMVNGRVLWRYFSGGPIRRKVEATDRDVFAGPERVGLVRLDRDTGREIWINKIAQRFLATNFKYLYATDRLGQLLVLDYHRGSTLAKYDTSEWILPTANDLTDRIYLANHDGQILCLRHRDEREPIRIKAPPREEETKEEKKEPAPEKEPEKKDEKKPADEKDKDKDKEKEKDKDKDKGKDKDKDKVGARELLRGAFAAMPVGVECTFRSRSLDQPASDRLPASRREPPWSRRGRMGS